MARRGKKQSQWLTILAVVAAVALWAIDQRKDGTEAAPRPQSRESVSTPPAQSPSRLERKSSDHARERQGRYEVHRNSTLAKDRSNDGDSFRVILADGRREIFRLYFVDTPESGFRSYRNGETNHQRIREQAEYFGVSSADAVELGLEGKKFVLDLLGKRPFTLYTEWDSPFRDQRYHAFIQINEGGKPRWLHELLIEKGFARLKTKPADLPDGTKANSHRGYLESLQATARKSRKGGWGMAIPAGVR
jgi:endonuclease YncB( thermonuclease family)